MKALYRTVDLLALRLDPEQKCSVVEDQQEGETHVYVWRAGQPAPERIRKEDLQPYGTSQISHERREAYSQVG